MKRVLLPSPPTFPGGDLLRDVVFDSRGNRAIAASSQTTSCAA